MVYCEDIVRMLFLGKREGLGRYGLVSKYIGEWMREGRL